YYAQPHIGGDIPLFYGIAKSLVARGAIDAEYIASRTEGWEALRREIDERSWESIERGSGVSRSEIERLAGHYANAKAALFCWTMGMTHHAFGVDNVRMIANLALMRGMVGKPSAGLLPLRGHSNVQGVGSMGATPALKKRVFDALESRLGVKLPTSAGMDTLACIERAGEGGVDFAMHLGGNLFGSCPDADKARAALGRIGMTVFLSTTLNTGHAHGRGQESIILPVRARDEESQPTTQESMFSFVRLSDGGPPRHEGPRGEVQVVASIAKRVLGSAPVDFEALERHADLRRLIGEIIPGYEPMKEIDETRREFHVGGRFLHGERFETPSGRARFHAPPIPPPVRGDESNSLALMTIRSEGQFNTVVYEQEDVYRGQERRDVILMNSDDISRLGLRDNDPVTVTSEAGSLDGVLVRTFQIRAGNAAMYYPEANAIVPQRVDPESRTPAFKSVAIRVTKSRRLSVVGG
ncbi:MAG: histidine kinase, partial [Phycisphaerae bacterium]|nr:histidine kinase [Phycisphaerae bacterium]